MPNQTFSAVSVFPGRAVPFTAWIRALRPHQWSKNVLIFLPLLLSHQCQQWRLLPSLQAFFAFCCCASAFYVLNDILDTEADRSHKYKSRRPFASGQLAAQQGYLLLAACLAGSVALAWTLPIPARLLLLLYALTNLGYSVLLKQIVFLDVLVLALLYAFRLLFGGAAEHIHVSRWTLAFSLFLFLGLALVKRWTELLSTAESNGGRLARRGYRYSHIRTVETFAYGSLFLSVAVLALYINSLAASELYRHSQLLWLVCLLLMAWVLRVTFITDQGRMTDDPLLFAFKDAPSRAIAVLVAVCGAWATGF